MLRIIESKSSSGASAYFSSADYFKDGQELQGRWYGKAAERLGLSGEIRKKEWDALCDNRNPVTNQPLTVRRKDNRRVGYDFNFRANKSLSLLYGLTRDPRLLDAFRAAVSDTMQDMEAEMQTRVRRDGRDEDRLTGNMLWGEYIHTTARPVDGVADPHLHAHCFVHNLTWDSKEDRWKAGQFAGLKRDAPYFEALFHNRLATRLGELGLAIERKKNGWEIAGFGSKLLGKFSRRSAVIDALAALQRVSDPAARMDLSTKSREHKQRNLSLPELQAEWHGRLTPDERHVTDQVIERIGSGAVERQANAATLAATIAIQHCFERKAVLPEREILRDALRRSIGTASAEATLKAVKDRGLLVAMSNGRAFATTTTVLSEEQRMIQFARRGRGSCTSLVPMAHTFRDARLNPQQRAAVTHVLTSHDRVMAISGKAGVGKTTLMKEAVDAIEAAGTRVFTFAPSADASRVVLRAEGFVTSDTVARLLVDTKLQEEVAGGVLWIDEAGLIGSRTMCDIFDLAARIDARVILSGDRQQHSAVERGDALRLLEEDAGIVPAEVRDIQRQSGSYRAAVEKLGDGRVAEGFRDLDGLGWIKEMDDDEREQAIARDYVQSTAAGLRTLVIAPTHREGEGLTAAIRHALQQCGRLGTQEHEVLQLSNLRLTEGDRMDRITFDEGTVLQFTQNAKGHGKGDRLVVRGQSLPLDQAKRFSAYQPGILKLSVGEAIRITAGGTTKDGKKKLENGAIYTVKRFTKHGDIVLTNGWTIARDFGHVAYGYTSTSHASQGKTVDKVILSESSGSFGAASREQFYVSVSRGKREAAIFTDNKQGLLQAVMRSDARITATDLLLARDREARGVVLRQVQERVAPPRSIASEPHRDIPSATYGR